MREVSRAPSEGRGSAGDAPGDPGAARFEGEPGADLRTCEEEAGGAKTEGDRAESGAHEAADESWPRGDGDVSARDHRDDDTDESASPPTQPDGAGDRDGPARAGAAESTRTRLASTEMRALVERYVRRRVPASEVEDLVQAIFVEALEAKRPPTDARALRKWLTGIARHEVADLHRRRGRVEQVQLPEQMAGEEAPLSAREWARWAEQQTEGDEAARQTLGWMAREGGGEKLAHIAADESLPAPQVRQRVSRLRRFLKSQYKAELAAVAAVLVMVVVAWQLLREPEPRAVVPAADPAVERAAELRRAALAACDDSRWRRCVDLLDDAARLDPAGDDRPAIREARKRAREALEEAAPDAPERNEAPEEPTAAPERSAAPTASAAPTSAPPPKAPPIQQSPPKKSLPKKSLPKKNPSPKPRPEELAPQKNQLPSPPPEKGTPAPLDLQRQQLKR